MRIAIFGTGGVGYFGGRLAQSGADVVDKKLSNKLGNIFFGI